MGVSLLLLLLVPLIQGQEYVPGTPGAPWTKEEVLIVKSKLFAIFNRNGMRALDELYGGSSHGVDWHRAPNAPKMLRLGFHDCVKYDDGTGGCDGCLNWEGVGVRHPDSTNTFSLPNVGQTNNNGLGPTVEVLEGIYTRPEFPSIIAPSLNVSLKASGKSRADLWALATIAAVEHGIQTTNLICDEEYNGNPEFQCNAFIGTDTCHAYPTRNIEFQTGRADCTEFGEEPYMATKHEVHPNAVGNGKMTADFFQEHFDFTGRETVAIMGAHTMGSFHYHISLFRYIWTAHEHAQFNNVYYKNIVREPKYSWYDYECTKITDAEGNIPRRRWLAHVRSDTENGGPVHWISENYQCRDICTSAEPECCVDVGQCVADADLLEDDPDVNTGCELFKFIVGVDEMAIPSEIGLYFDFEVTEDGIPYGCPGFHNFNTTWWQDGFKYTWTNMEEPCPGCNNPNTHLGWRAIADPQCGPNTLEYPPGSTPLHQVFEEYAADQQLWLDEFVPALEKMLSNGYDNLVTGPDQTTNVFCNRVDAWVHWDFTNCILTDDIETQDQFSIVSRNDGKAIKGQEDGHAVMWTRDDSDLTQKWVMSTTGHQLINVATGLPLITPYGKNWVWNEDTNMFMDPRINGASLARDNNQNDGAPVIDSHGWHRFWMLAYPNSQLDPSTEIVKIVSQLDNRVMQGSPNGGARMMTSSDNLAQQWARVPIDGGERFINMETQLPLFVSFNEDWSYNPDTKLIISLNGAPRAIDRGWNQFDGANVAWYNAHGAPNQQFTFEPIA